jgi:large subunit ribosomal protein L24
MKLRKEDKVIVITGRDKGKTGTVLSVMPAVGKVVVDGVNIAKRHTKPSQKNPRGGILEITKPIDVSKLMVLDPASGKPARVGFEIKADGTKERIFKVSPNHDRKTEKTTKPTKSTKTESTSDKPTTKESPKVAKSETKVGKK